MTTLVELCAGTAAVSLRCMAGLSNVHPLTGYMGGKRRWSTYLAEVLGFGARPPDHLVLVDGGPWGDVWTTLKTQEGRDATAAVLDGWSFRNVDPHKLWAGLVEVPPDSDPGERAAQYLWLQARSAGCIPVWWSPERGRWESPSGSRQNHRSVDVYRASAMDPGLGSCDASSRSVGKACATGALRAEDRRLGFAAQKGGRGLGKAHQKDGKGIEGAHQRGIGSVDASTRQKMAKGPAGTRGIQRPATIADRIRRLDWLPWDRIEVVHGDVRDVDPIAGAVLYMDPPYQGCPRYARTLPREDVVAIAQRWHAEGCRVALSEAEALPVAGWHSSSLPGAARPEVLTTSWALVRDEQMRLFA